MAFFLCPIAFLFSSEPIATPPYQLSVCAVFQDEDFYLKEWLEFHKLMGVEHFYLYNNLSTDRYQEILQPYIESGIVELFDWSVETHNQQEYLLLLQLPVYNHALNIAKETSRWIAFLDLDEFLFPVQHASLIEFLQDYPECAGLSVNWQIYGTSGFESLLEGELITENLIYKAYEENSLNQIAKMIVQPLYVRSIDNPHYFQYEEGYFAVDSSKNRVPDGVIGHSVILDKVRINHYWCGTRDWLINHKIPRRKKWGIILSEDALEAVIASFNQIKDEAILKFVPELKKNMETESFLSPFTIHSANEG